MNRTYVHSSVGEGRQMPALTKAKRQGGGLTSIPVYRILLRAAEPSQRGVIPDWLPDTCCLTLAVSQGQHGETAKNLPLPPAAWLSNFLAESLPLLLTATSHCLSLAGKWGNRVLDPSPRPPLPPKLGSAQLGQAHIDRAFPTAWLPNSLAAGQ